MQSIDPVSSVKEIGFAVTLVLLLLTAIGLAIRWAAKKTTEYFTTRLDKKDEQLNRLQEERHADVLRVEKVLETNIQALHQTTELQGEQIKGQQRIVEVLGSLASEMREYRKPQQKQKSAKRK